MCRCLKRFQHGRLWAAYRKWMLGAHIAQRRLHEAKRIYLIEAQGPAALPFNGQGSSLHDVARRFRKAAAPGEQVARIVHQAQRTYR